VCNKVLVYTCHHPQHNSYNVGVFYLPDALCTRIHIHRKGWDVRFLDRTVSRSFLRLKCNSERCTTGDIMDVKKELTVHGNNKDGKKESKKTEYHCSIHTGFDYI